jgi:CRISPR-associated protein Csx16
MTTWFISRHPGAIAWASLQGLQVDRHIAQLELEQLKAGDTVIGSLPVNLVAEVCARGARYLNLSLDLPAHLRGQELSQTQMSECNARLETYTVSSLVQDDKAIEEQSLQIIAQLPLMQILVKARSLGMQQPQNIGSAWHGGLGKVLHDTEPQAYALLYGDEQSSEANGPQAKPYVLRPPALTASLDEGAEFEFSLILIGHGVAHASALTNAIHHLARAGVGPGRGQFSVEDIECQTINLGANAVPMQARDIVLRLMSPTLLKEDNAHIKHAPSLPLLLKRILSRVDIFLSQIPESTPISNGLRQRLLDQASVAHTSNAQVTWHSTPRYSARQKAWMPFGGVVGLLQYQNVAFSILVWLQLAEWLHVGNKTSFGHGRIGVFIAS